uniref:Secretion protein HlyD n=1 Tax=Chlorobium chlorochromatii (strain CaD3) TaxID=340177 RepID=Q3ARA9_CHLCH
MNNIVKPVLFIALCSSLTLSGCGDKPEMGRDGAKNQEQPALVVQQLQPSDAVVVSRYPALLEGKVTVEIRPQVDGVLRSILIDEGAFVKAGQPLFAIDDAVYRAQYQGALASQHAAEARVVAAKLEVERLQPLVQNQVIAEVQLETARANYKAAQAAFDVAVAATRSAKVNLDYTVIKAPINGFVGKITLRQGSLVTKNQAAWLTMLSDVSEVYASFSISENELLRFRQQYGQSDGRLGSGSNNVPATLVLADGTRYPQQGRLATLSGQFDALTGAMRVRAIFANPQALLRSGGTGSVELSSSYNNVILVPQSATVEMQDKVFVMRLMQGNKVQKQAITIAAKSGNNYVVTGGIQAGDTIVLVGADRLQDGMVITPRYETSPAQSATINSAVKRP